ncbi:MAG: YeiH family protein [Bacillota bacterium]
MAEKNCLSAKNKWFNLKAVFPGLLTCLMLGVFSRWLDQVALPRDFHIINYVLIAILLGLLIKNLLSLPESFIPGIEFSAKTCLYAGIIFLGARLNLLEVFSVGASAIILVMISITACLYICGRLIGITHNNERWGHLVGAGIGVCGISAIIALSPVIKAKEKEILTAVGAVLLNDIILIFLLPAIGNVFNWSDSFFGYIAGVVPSNTAQSIAIGYSYSDLSGMITTVVKSVRNALMPLFILVMAYLYSKKGLPVGSKISLKILWDKFPKFIIGFLFAVLLNTFSLFTPEMVGIAGEISAWFFVVSFVGIGASIDIKQISIRDLSILFIGLGMAALVGVYAFMYTSYILLL